jgi:hypothetical protein
VEGGHTGALVGGDGAGHVEDAAVAGVGVGDDRQGGRRRNHRGHAGHLRHAEQPEVGQALRRGGPEARQVDGPEAGALGAPCLQAVEHERGDDAPVPQQPAQARAGARAGVGGHVRGR